MATKIQHNLEDSELKNAYENIGKALTGLFRNSDGTKDFSKSKSILQKYYNKNNPIFDINEPIPGMGFGTWTPLCVVSYYDNDQELKLLLENGADPNYSIDNSAIPLNLAAAKNSESACFHLIKYGADINKKDIHNKTSFMRACEYPNVKPSIIEMFFKNPQGVIPDIMALNSDNETAMDIAKKVGNRDIARRMEFHKMNSNLKIKGLETGKRVKI